VDKLQFAKWFVEHGFAIFPIDLESKKPVIKEWQKYSTTPLSDEEKAKYLEMIKNGYNYAVPGGQRNLVILDFEDKELLKAWIGENALNELCSKTLCVNTVHGGIHIYVTADEIPPQKFNPVFEKENKGIADLQSYNSYVVGPGSCINHRYCESDKCPWKGQDYTTCYINNNNNEIGKVDLKGLLRFLAEKGKKLGIELSGSARAWLFGEKSKEEPEEDLEKLVKEMAKYDHFKGKTVDAIREEVCKKLKEKLETVQSEKAKGIFKTAYGVVCEKKTYAEMEIDRSRGDWRVLTVLLSLGVTNLSALEQLLPEDSKVFAPKWDKYFLHTLKKAWNYAKPALEFQTKARGKSEREAKKIAKSIITSAILERFKIKTFYNTTGHNQAIIGVFVWDRRKGVFMPFDKGLRKVIRRMAELLEIRSREKTLAQLSKRDVDDIFDEIKDLTLTPLPKEPLRVAFKNGTLEWTDTGVTWYDVKERTPKQYAFYYLPFDLKFDEIEKFGNKEITVEDVEQLARRLCPKTLEVFKSWVDDKWVTLFEIIGYTLYPEIKFRKAFMLVGEGKNGKSTFINLVKELLGNYAENISPRELFDSQNRFIVSNLYHKLANAVAESKDYTIEDMDRFKRLTGGDWFTADVKFKDPITFKNIAKLIVASNNMPHLRDPNDKAFWHRWVIIEFPHQFPDDDTWAKRTFTDEEKNGIITVALLAFIRVVQQRHFDFEQNEKEVMDIWLSYIDSVYSFIKTYTGKGVITVDPRNADLWVKRSDLYKLYKDYCIDQGFRGVGAKSFARKLREYFGVTTVLKNINGERVRAFVGIAVNEIEKARLSQANENLLDEFINYVKNNNGMIKEFWEIVKDFGNDRNKANRFVTWCLKKSFCDQRGINAFEIHT
jgi:putative DNA primase/helicase